MTNKVPAAAVWAILGPSWGYPGGIPGRRRGVWMVWMRLKWAPVDPEWNSGMWNSGQIQSILDGAQDPQQSAVGRLDQGDTRDAAEKAWGATRRATGA